MSQYTEATEATTPSEKWLTKLAKDNAICNERLAAMRRNADLNQKRTELEAVRNKIMRKEAKLNKLRENALKMEHIFDKAAVFEAQASRARNTAPVIEKGYNRLYNSTTDFMPFMPESGHSSEQEN
jgi:hypothetical protein